MAVITISRQFGSGGDEIAARVCEMLGYTYFDKKLMSQVAIEAGLSESEIVDFSEQNYKAQSFLERLFGRRRTPVAQVGTWREDAKGTRIAEARELGDEQAIDLVRATIQAACRRDNVVIVGRGGQAILADKPGVLHVRIEAPLDVRIEAVRAQEKILRAAAEEMVAERDRASSDYLKRFYGIDVSDLQHYDLAINTGRINPTAAARLIVSAVSELAPAPVPEPG